mmetsp:Transcript_63067/g.146883  ORF Transcript_63067/g.146883 Transcript_63067/m.146883 type:complete len:238 (+) Transcript_63067:2-715(+)
MHAASAAARMAATTTTATTTSTTTRTSPLPASRRLSADAAFVALARKPRCLVSGCESFDLRLEGVQPLLNASQMLTSLLYLPLCLLGPPATAGSPGFGGFRMSANLQGHRSEGVRQLQELLRREPSVKVIHATDELLPRHQPVSVQIEIVEDLRRLLLQDLHTSGLELRANDAAAEEASKSLAVDDCLAPVAVRLLMEDLLQQANRSLEVLLPLSLLLFLFHVSNLVHVVSHDACKR